MSNDMHVTVVGWVATDPRHLIAGSGRPYTFFRVASTPRYFDRGTGQWHDKQTEWFQVRIYGEAAMTVAASVRTGQPVVVYGRLRTSRWESEAGPRTDLTIDVTAIGHDLTRGRASFVRTVVRMAGADGQAEAGGAQAGADGPASAEQRPGAAPEQDAAASADATAEDAITGDDVLDEESSDPGEDGEPGEDGPAVVAEDSGLTPAEDVWARAVGG